jgi:D-ribose pyranose/furanose isomerase RbsD
VELANRYIELVSLFQVELQRELDLNEIHIVKNILAKELKEGNRTLEEYLCSEFTQLEGK